MRSIKLLLYSLLISLLSTTAKSQDFPFSQYRNAAYLNSPSYVGLINSSILLNSRVNFNIPDSQKIDRNINSSCFAIRGYHYNTGLIYEKSDSKYSMILPFNFDYINVNNTFIIRPGIAYKMSSITNSNDLLFSVFVKTGSTKLNNELSINSDYPIKSSFLSSDSIKRNTKSYSLINSTSFELSYRCRFVVSEFIETGTNWKTEIGSYLVIYKKNIRGKDESEKKANCYYFGLWYRTNSIKEKTLIYNFLYMINGFSISLSIDQQLLTKKLSAIELSASIPFNYNDYKSLRKRSHVDCPKLGGNEYFNILSVFTQRRSFKAVQYKPISYRHKKRRH